VNLGSLVNKRSRERALSKQRMAPDEGRTPGDGAVRSSMFACQRQRKRAILHESHARAPPLLKQATHTSPSQHKRTTTELVKPYDSCQARGGACCALRIQITIKGLEGRASEACFKNICSNIRTSPLRLTKASPACIVMSRR